MKAQQYSPIVVAHRGYSSLFPENTLESLQAGMLKAHYVQFDILLTKDDQIIVFHDRFLSVMTDIEKHPQFAGRKNDYVNDVMNGEVTHDWWVRDFTLEELRTLRVRQRSAKRPQLRHQVFRISTLDELIEEILYIKQNNLKDNTSGFLIEVKGEQECKEDAQRDTVFVSKLAECLARHGLASKEECKEKRLPIILQSFNTKVMRELAQQLSLDLPLLHLFDKHVVLSKEFLATQISPQSYGIGIRDQATKQTKELCQSAGLALFFWACIDDQTEYLPASIPTYQHAYFCLFSLGFDGVITDFPQNCHAYLSLFKAGK